ncbi:unnamed protein product [marine sediment metagenome]|uniref:HNH nuclease domain-containing protein n=1 Tax=marine sediment metagenome TaxID=412755 RepID=X1F841_9ZZZZ
MPKEQRRVLTQDEKSELLNKHRVCYICLKTLEGYSSEEIEFDHIYNYADGYPQDLSNFAPVHASKDPRKLNCHKAKGRKNPYEYREELSYNRILTSFSNFILYGLLNPKWIVKKFFDNSNKS